MRLPFVSRSAHEREVETLRVTLEAQIQAVRVEASEAASSIARAALQSPYGIPVQPSKGAYALDYPVQFQTPMSPRRKSTQVIDAGTLRRIVDACDPLRSAIEQIKRELRSIPRKIVSRSGEETDSINRKIEEAKAFFAPSGGMGGRGESLRTYETRIVEDILVVGAMAAYRHPTLGGQIYEIYAIDAATIMPRVDQWGFPIEGAKYAQWVQGVPVATFTSDELAYLGLNAESWTPYYRSPVEWILSPLTSYVKVDEWNRVWLTDGNAPGDDVFTMPADMTPQQIQAWITLFDQMNAASTAERRKIKILPTGSDRLSPGTRKDQDFAGFETQLIRRICSVMGVQPASIGYAGEQYKVSQDGSREQTSEYGVGAVAEVLKEHYDDTLNRLGFDDLEYLFVSDKEEDASTRATRNRSAVGKPWKTRNEARAEDGLDPIPGWDEEDIEGPEDLAEDDEQPAPSKKEKPEDTKERALMLWERKALTRLKKGRSPACDFESPLITAATSARILGALRECRTAADVTAVFRAEGDEDDQEPEPAQKKKKKKRKALILFFEGLTDLLEQGLVEITSTLTTDLVDPSLVQSQKVATLNDWATSFRDMCRDAHVQAYATGCKLAGVTPSADDVADGGRRGWTEQEKYFAKFLKDLDGGRYTNDDGALKEKQILARAKAYVSALGGTVHDGFVNSLGANVQINWVLGDLLHCGPSDNYPFNCPELADGGPYTKETLPTVPRKMQTPCGSHCGCHLETADGRSTEGI